MIREFEFFHGVIFSKILHSSQKQVSLKAFPTADNASYVLNNKVGIYIKYSTKRLSPWRFSFQKRHQDEILEMQNAIGETFLLLVCNDDGVACLSFEELRQVLNASHEEVEWISVTRTKGKMYSVKGSDGKLEFKLGKDDFSEKVLANAYLPAEEKPRFSFSWFKKNDKQ